MADLSQVLDQFLRRGHGFVLFGRFPRGVYFVEKQHGQLLRSRLMAGCRFLPYRGSWSRLRALSPRLAESLTRFVFFHSRFPCRYRAWEDRKSRSEEERIRKENKSFIHSDLPLFVTS
jgi:hypothetical protein